MAAGTVTPGEIQVSIIVPARNEEACLAKCLESLTQQTEISTEIIVVDDGSTDQTRQIAETFPHVRVLTPGPLRAEWSGKVNAMEAGATQTRGQWLLFTDADTVHKPGSLQRALQEAEEHRAALLSYSPAQKVETFWEKVVMPVVFAELATTFRPTDVSNPRSSAAAANGQYMLISRDGYESVGGFAAVATSLLEDVALARNLKKSGKKIFFRYAPDAVETRMYRDFRELRDGWTKNLALLFPDTSTLAMLRLVEFALITGSATTGFLNLLQGRRVVGTASLGVGALLYGIFLHRMRKAHFAANATLLSLAGLPVFSYLLLRSRLFHERGRVNWKGRTYGHAKQLRSPAGESERIAT
jgi:cellulose synthase/poly-beta-1,6-N-acetylglucosamine synthase-like glycosyltransferase